MALRTGKIPLNWELCSVSSLPLSLLLVLPQRVGDSLLRCKPNNAAPVADPALPFPLGSDPIQDHGMQKRLQEAKGKVGAEYVSGFVFLPKHMTFHFQKKKRGGVWKED